MDLGLFFVGISFSSIIIIMLIEKFDSKCTRGISFELEKMKQEMKNKEIR